MTMFSKTIKVGDIIQVCTDERNWEVIDVWEGYGCFHCLPINEIDMDKSDTFHRSEIISHIKDDKKKEFLAYDGYIYQQMEEIDEE